MPNDSASSVPQPRCNGAVRHPSQQQPRSGAPVPRAPHVATDARTTRCRYRDTDAWSQDPWCRRSATWNQRIQATSGGASVWRSSPLSCFSQALLQRTRHPAGQLSLINCNIDRGTSLASCCPPKCCL